jgi:hypothetical protein
MGIFDQGMLADPGQDEDYDSQIERAKRAQAFIDQLRNQKSPEAGQMVGKFYVPTSRTQLLAPGINSVVGTLMQDRQQDLDAQRQQKMRAGAEQWMSQRPQPTMKEQPGPPTEEGVGPAPREVAPTPEAKLAWAMQGQRNPLSRALAAKYAEDQLIHEPTRVEARKNRVEDREDTQLARKEQYEANLTFKMEQLKEQARQADNRAQDARNSAEDRERARQDGLEIRRQGMALQSQLFEYRKQHDKDVAEAKVAAEKAKTDAAGKKMSDKARSELDKQDAATTALAEGIELLDKAPDKGTGYLPGLVTDFVPGGQSLVAKYRDDKTNNAVQKLTFVTDEIRHGRFGSALTKVERASAAQYLPDPYDDKAAMLRKSRGLQDLIDLNNRRLREKGAAAETGDLVESKGPGIPRVTNDADWEKLPKGATFVGPDGKQRVK